MGEGWRARWIAFRNARLMDPRFQRFAWGFPPFRRVAHGHARALFDLVAGFTYSQWLVAGIELGLFERLRAGPLSADVLGAAMGLEPGPTDALLRALVSLKLVEPVGDGRFALGWEGAPLAVDPGIQAMVRHHRHLYADLADPVALLKRRGGGALSGYWPYAEGRAGGVGPYSALMAASQPAVAEAVLQAVDFRGVRRLLDVGGGAGAFLAAVGARHPAIGLMLFDLPEVIADARLAPQADRVGGRFPADPLPPGADMVTLVRILHDHDDATVEALLGRVHAALPPGGRLLVAEPMAETPGAEPMGDAYFGAYLLAMGSGRPRTPAAIGAMLRSAGFTRVQQRGTHNPFATQVVEGVRRP